MTRTALLRPLASALALAGMLVACGGGGGNPGIGIASGFEPVTFPAGHRKPAPSFSGTTLRDDQPISNAILSGKVGVVNFWGSWCGPCRREQGPLETLSKQYGARVQFVGVNARRDQKAAALAYLDEFGVTYPSVFNPDSSIAYAFRVRFMPATFVIDRQGKIAAEFIGAIADVNALRVVIGSELS
jgi:thiol-disulfide isomerase/thioredoxin